MNRIFIGFIIFPLFLLGGLYWAHSYSQQGFGERTIHSETIRGSGGADGISSNGNSLLFERSDELQRSAQNWWFARGDRETAISEMEKSLDELNELDDQDLDIGTQDLLNERIADRKVILESWRSQGDEASTNVVGGGQVIKTNSLLFEPADKLQRIAQSAFLNEDSETAVTELERALDSLNEIEKQNKDLDEDTLDLLNQRRSVWNDLLDSWNKDQADSASQPTDQNQLVAASSELAKEAKPEKKTSLFGLSKLLKINRTPKVEDTVVPTTTTNNQLADSKPALPKSNGRIEIEDQPESTPKTQTVIEVEADKPAETKTTESEAPAVEETDPYQPVVIREQPSITIAPPPPMVKTAQPDPVVIDEEIDSSFEADTDDKAMMWYRAYLKMESAKKFEADGNSEAALKDYQESKSRYDVLHSRFPAFQKDIVRTNREKLTQKISSLRDIY